MLDETIILHYFEGTLGEKETALLNSWLQESEEHLAYFHSMKEAYLEMNAKSDRMAADTDAEWKRFLGKSGSLKKSSILKRIEKITSIAASVGCIFLAGWLIGSKATEEHHINGTTTVRTDIGQQSSLTLPDGTEVQLNSCSELVYDPISWREERRVQLVGQASFDVTHLDGLPFKVASSLYEVEVLGTEFDISCYEEDSKSMVALRRGKVAVSLTPNDIPAILSPGQTFTYDKTTGDYIIRQLPDKVSSSWKNKTIIFYENSLLDKVGELKRNYGYTFEIAPECAKFIYNGEFREERIGDLLEILKTVTPDLKYKLDDNNKTIRIWK